MGKRRAVWVLGAGLVALTAVLTGAVPAAREQASSRARSGGSARSNLVGAIRAADGAPLEGVVISARAPGASITTSVFTDERGAYVFPALPAGPYNLWAQATGYETARAHVTIQTAGRTQQAFTLNAIADLTPQLTPSEWLAALPEDTKEQRRLKAIFRTNCTACHPATYVFQNRFDENGWRAVIGFMERNTGTGNINRHTTVVHYEEELAEYLASVRGPSAPPLTFGLDPRPRGDAARVVITEYDVPLAGARSERAWNDGSDWSFGWPTASMGARWIHDVVPDNDGNAWGTRDRGPADMTLFKIDTATGQVTGVKVMNGQAIRRSHSITKDQNGIIWFDGGDGPLGRLDPKTERIEMFFPPLNMGGGQLTTVDVDAQGTIWGATTGGANRFDPETKTWMHFSSIAWPRNFVYGTAGDAAGHGWWTQYTADRVVTADPTTGKTFEVLMRPPWVKEEDVTTEADREWYRSMGVMTWGNINTVPHGQQPRRMGADKRGEFVWVPNNAGNNLARINIRTLETKYYALQGNPYFVTVDRDSNVWTNLFADAKVARLDPRTEQFTYYTLPSRCESRNISVDNIRGDVWVPCANTSRVIRLRPRTEAEIEALR
ncbi:MAG: carboxypeptidase regulatory-like domain-containing protein [Acidobacteria bacterium]|nr:carboxypeptidase regulatory-like domain-containing protein [Acidobacteriota bacterium]